MLTGKTSPDQDRHADVIESLDDIKTAIRAIKATAEPPTVNVTVEPPIVTVPPSSVVVEPHGPITPVSYRFTVYRGDHGLIKSVLAEPII